jgi:hypothetical protein
MAMMRLALKCIILILLLNGRVSGQAVNEPYDTLENLMQKEGFEQEEIPDKNEKPAIALRPVNSDSLHSDINEKDFAYMQYIDSLFRHRNDAKSVANPVQPASKPTPNVDWIRMLLWVVSVSALLFIVYRVWFGKNKLFDSGGQFGNENAGGPSSQKISPAWLAQEAIGKRDYRQAVRYMFIELLDGMADRGLIAQTPDKTNQQYLREVEQTGMRQALAGVMLQYEYVWYGEFTPDEQQFSVIQKTFKQFQKEWL